jgi:hypothetical protein
MDGAEPADIAIDWHIVWRVGEDRCGAVLLHQGPIGRLVERAAAMDPVRAAVNDELSSAFSALKRNAPGGTAIGRQMDIEGARLLTPNLAIGAETSWIDRGGNPSGATGVDGVRLNLKGLLYRDDPREMLLSAGLTWGLPRVGPGALAQRRSRGRPLIRIAAPGPRPIVMPCGQTL